MRLNPLNLIFGIGLGKFLEYMVNKQGIEANPAKIQPLLICNSQPNHRRFKASLEGLLLYADVYLRRLISVSYSSCSLNEVKKGSNSHKIGKLFKH